MNYRRIIIAFLVIALIFNTLLTSFSAAQAQSALLFDGTIAYIDSTGNVVITNGMGGLRQITSDASTEDGAIYSRPTFSPNGKYLAYVNDARAKLMIYDIQADNILKEMEYHYSTSFIQWHKDSDSYIFAPTHVNDTDQTNVDCLRDYYQYYVLTGEQKMIYKICKRDNGFNINFDLDNIVYTTGIGSSEAGVVLENWNSQIKHTLPSKVAFSAVGIWTPDGQFFVKDELSDDGKVFIINIESGELKKEIDVSDLIKNDRNSVYVSPAYLDVSSDSKHLLIHNSANLYDLNIELATIKHIYKSQYLESGFDPFDILLGGMWSANENLIMVYENDPQIKVYENYTNLIVVESGQPQLISNDVYPFFWINNLSERFLYAKNKFVGEKTYPELTIYDHKKQTSTKLGDLPSKNSDSLYDYGIPIEFLVDWTATEYDLPPNTVASNNATPIPLISSTPSTIDEQQNPSISNFFGNISYLIYCLICLLFLIILIILAVVFFSRTRKNKKIREENQKHEQFQQTQSNSAEQIKQAIALAKSNKQQEAFEILRKLVQVEPKNASAWFNLGGVLTSMNNYKDAERCYSRAKQLGHPKADNALDWLRQKDKT